MHKIEALKSLDRMKIFVKQNFWIAERFLE